MFDYTKLDPEQCEFVVVANVDEIPNGERIFIEVGYDYLVVFNIAGDFYAIADLCTHDEGPLEEGELEGFEVACPRHGARFDVRSGEALTLPAVEGIPAYPVRVREGHVEVGFPIE
jgi:3-phenylpropionate/trans-cinnamate dioxygenase ferredoxin subunit